MLNREAFLRRTAVRFRVETAANRGWNAREVQLAEFVFDELCKEIIETLQSGMQDFFREVSDTGAELGYSS